jgi:general secretion pathway protein D
MDEPEPEVIMEVEVLEISHTLMQQLGIDYPTSATFTPNPVSNGVAATATTAGAGLVLADLAKQNSHTISVSSLALTVDLLKTVGDTNVLSSPRIRARNKEKAKILVGNRVPVITSGTSATVGGSYSTSSVQYLDVGLTLEVQPTIHSDGNVAIKVGLEVSSIANTLNVPIGNGGTTIAYEISTRNANTLLELRDGETQVLAGLIQDSDSLSSNHIPGLGDMPIIGKLFGSDNKQRNKSEIVLAITPRIIRAQHPPSSDTTEFWFGTESQTRSAPFVSSPSAPQDSAPAPTATPTPTAPLMPPPAPNSSAPAVEPGGVSSSTGGVGGAAPPPVPTSAAGHPAPRVIESAALPGAPAPAADPGADAPASGAVPPPTAAAEGVHASGASDSMRRPESAAEGKPRITLEGPDSARVGDEINVAVKLATSESLGRVRAQVRFDASSLQLLGADPGELAPAGDTPKIDQRPGGLQLELEGGSNAPVTGTGTLMSMHFRVTRARPNVAIDTQVVLVGEDGVAVAATAATPLKIAVSP